MSSLPVPVSPRMRTDTGLAATSNFLAHFLHGTALADEGRSAPTGASGRVTVSRISRPASTARAATLDQASASRRAFAVIVSPELGGLDGGLDCAVRRHQNHGQARLNREVDAPVPPPSPGKRRRLRPHRTPLGWAWRSPSSPRWHTLTLKPSSWSTSDRFSARLVSSSIRSTRERLWA